MMFLPCHERFSIDSFWMSETIEAGKYTRSQNTTSLATFGMLLQLDLIYQFTSTFKISPRWSADGSAIYYVLNNLAFVYPPIGRDILLKFVPFSVLSILTKATLLLERCAFDRGHDPGWSSPPRPTRVVGQELGRRWKLDETCRTHRRRQARTHQPRLMRP